MVNIDGLVKKVEEFTPISAFFLWIFSVVYISNNNIFDLGEKFTIVSSGILAFVAVFYTVVVVSGFLKKLNDLNTDEINKLKEKIKKIISSELENLDKNSFDKNSELCTEKSSLYSELSNIKNRKINKFLFISAFLLIIMLIVDSNFIPTSVFGINNYKPYVLLTAFWIVISQIMKILVLFYKIYTE